MQPIEHRSLNRRDLLRQGGLAISLGAVLAACGSTEGSTDPGRIGLAVPSDGPDIDVSVDDAVLLRTLQSLEYSVIDLYTRVLATGAFGAQASLIERFIADHEQNATELGDLVEQAGGATYDCANEFYMERSVDPAIEAIDTSDDPHRDALNTADAFETTLGASAQLLVARISDPALRAAPMLIGGSSHRRAAVVALEANPGTIFNPEITGDEADNGGDVPMPYAIPAAFGQVGGLTLIVGAADVDGARTELSLQPPAENSFVYNDLSC